MYHIRMDTEKEGKTNTAVSDVPRDVVLIDQILRQMGTQEYNPKVVAQLLEFIHRN